MRANGNNSSAGSTTENNEATMENSVSTGSTEENQGSRINQGSAGSIDAKKIPTGSLLYNEICAGNAGEHMAPADNRKDSTGSADLKKVKCQKPTRKAQQRQPAQGRYQQNINLQKENVPHRLHHHRGCLFTASPLSLWSSG